MTTKNISKSVSSIFFSKENNKLAEMKMNNQEESELMKVIDALHSLFFEFFPISFSICTDDIILYVNNQFVKLANASSINELSGRMITDFIIDDFENYSNIDVDIKSLPYINYNLFKTVNGVTKEVIVNKTSFSFQNKEFSIVIIRDIKDEIKAQKAVIDSENEKRIILDNINCKIAYINQNFEYIWVNKSYSSTYNTTAKELEGKKCFEFIYDKNDICDNCPVKRTFDSGIRQEKVQNYGLENKFFHTFFNPVFDENKKVVGVIEIGYDITEKTLLELELKEKEKQNNIVVSNSYDSIIMLNSEGTIIFGSPSNNILFGYSNNDIINKSAFDFIHPDDVPIIKERFFNNLKNIGVEGPVEYRILKKDGTYLYVESMANNQIDNPNINATIINIRDISERKTIQDKLIESEQKYRTLFETMTEGVVYQDIEGKIISANSAAMRIMGISEEHFFKTYPFSNNIKILKEDGSEYCFEERPSIIALKTGKTVKNVIIGIFNPNINNYKWVLVNAVPLFKNGESKPFQVYTTLTDITDRKLAEDEKIRLIKELKNSNLQLEEKTNEISKLYSELSKSEKELRALNAGKDKFFGILAHDLKFSLSGFISMTKALSNDFKDLTLYDLHKTAFDIHQSSSNVYKLLDNLLQWARVQMGLIEINPVKFNLRDLGIEVIELSYHHASQKVIKIYNNIEYNTYVFADKNMLYCILRNLVHNAIKFSYLNGEISIGSEEYENYILVWVEDSGIGFDDDLLEKLFRIDTKTIRYGTLNEKGTGLGLILCREFAEIQGGKLWAENNYPKGAKFLFTINKKSPE